jgi:hypothetical protein
MSIIGFIARGQWPVVVEMGTWYLAFDILYLGGQIMIKTWLTAAILMVAVSVQAGDTPKKGKPAEALPVKAKIVAKKTSFVLNFGGKTAKQYKDSLSDFEPNKLPPLPVVDMALELTNTSEGDVQVWISGTPVKMMLDLKGPGAVSVTPRQFFPAIYFSPKPVTLKAGKSHTLPIATLSYGHRGIEHRAYWTEPGEYTLQASLFTGINPPPKGVQPERGGFGKVTIVSEPIKIKIQAKE